MGMIFGKAQITVGDGGLLPTLPGAKLDLGGVERTPVAGDNQMLGYTESPRPAMLTCEISLGEGYTLKQLRDMVKATITFQCDTGQQYTVRDAYTTKPLSLASGDQGKVPLEMAGMPAEEMMVAQP